MLSVRMGAYRATLGRKMIVVGVSPARWAGLRNGRATGARPMHLTAVERMVKPLFLPCSARGADMGISGFDQRISELGSGLPLEND